MRSIECTHARKELITCGTRTIPRTIMIINCAFVVEITSHDTRSESLRYDDHIRTTKITVRKLIMIMRALVVCLYGFMTTMNIP